MSPRKRFPRRNANEGGRAELTSCYAPAFDPGLVAFDDRRLLSAAAAVANAAKHENYDDDGEQDQQ